MFRLASLALAASALGALGGCQQQLSEECRELTGVEIEGGAAADVAKVQAFIDSAIEVIDSVDALAAEVEMTCRAMATDLGVTIPEPDRTELPVVNSCQTLAAEIDRIVTDALPTSAMLTVQYVPPVCSIETTAYARCVADCDVNVDANIEVMCMRGQLVGMCSGMCTGECRVTGAANCQGSCTGTCNGSCSGTCNGMCNGTCSVVDANGRCRGTCEGTCIGDCSATCTGSCSGECTVDVNGSCSGQCAGTCSVDFVAPRCEGQADVQADVQCEASCDAELRVEATCTEPSLTITYTDNVTMAARDRFADLLDTLDRNYPRFVAIGEKLEAVGAALTVFGNQSDGVSAAADRISSTAASCADEAFLLVLGRLGTVTLTVDVSIQVSASINDDRM